MQNLSFLHSLEVAQKFVVEQRRLYGGAAALIWWSKVILVISLSLSQAEQKNTEPVQEVVALSKRGETNIQTD